jgi:hypothetical protein
MYFVLGFVEEFGHRKAPRITEIKQRLNSASGRSFSFIILSPKNLIVGSSDNPNNSRKAAFPANSSVSTGSSLAGMPNIYIEMTLG